MLILWKSRCFSSCTRCCVSALQCVTEKPYVTRPMIIEKANIFMIKWKFGVVYSPMATKNSNKKFFLCSFFWVIPRCRNFMWGRFGTQSVPSSYSLFHLHTVCSIFIQSVPSSYSLFHLHTVCSIFIGRANKKKSRRKKLCFLEIWSV